MTRLLLILLGLILHVEWFAHAAEPSAASADFQRLEARYQADVRQAVEPITKRHIAELQNLQKRATQLGDLEGALAIKQRLAALGAAPQEVSTPAPSALSTSGAVPSLSKASFKKRLENTDWSWFTNHNFEGKQFPLRFFENGKCASPMGNTWDVVEPGAVDIFASQRMVLRVRFNPEMTDYKSDVTVGSGEQKSGKFIGKLKK